jgi:hypothetical protein
MLRCQWAKSNNQTNEKSEHHTCRSDNLSTGLHPVQKQNQKQKQDSQHEEKFDNLQILFINYYPAWI